MKKKKHRIDLIAVQPRIVYDRVSKETILRQWKKEPYRDTIVHND
jgi:hypothetical protein